MCLSSARGFAASGCSGSWPSLATHPAPLVPATIRGLAGTAFAVREPMDLDWIHAGVAVALLVIGAAMVPAPQRAAVASNIESPGRFDRGLGLSGDGRVAYG
jgi:hypothetical protein